MIYVAFAMINIRVVVLVTTPYILVSLVGMCTTTWHHKPEYSHMIACNAGQQIFNDLKLLRQ